MLCRWGHSRTMILLRSQLTFYTHVPITLPLRSKGDIFYSIIRGRDLNFVPSLRALAEMRHTAARRKRIAADTLR